MHTAEEYLQQYGDAMAKQQIVMESPNPQQRAELQQILDSIKDRPYGDAKVLILDEPGQRVDVFRDIATEVQKDTGVSTVVVKSPDLAAIVSTEMTRAQIESLQPPMSNEPNSAVALQAMPALLDADPVPGITMVGLSGILMLVTVFVTALAARRQLRVQA